MNTQLWTSILAYDFDTPPSEYGFSTRLANENYWTQDFTQQAILEYKKFMYLAAVSDMMVSPSEIIDTVWHQHLIFTQSYQDFCNLLGKQIQHVPSTHNKEDAEKFKQAKERTLRFYQEIFEEEPGPVWSYRSMYDSLHLDKARYKIRSFLVVGLLVFAVAIIPFYFLLRPVYVSIPNPYFLIGFVTAVAATFFTIESYNRKQLSQIVQQFDTASFIHFLTPSELIYLVWRELTGSVNSIINDLVRREVITVNSDHTMEMSGKGTTQSLEELQIMNVLYAYGRPKYAVLLMAAMVKPVITNTANCMDALEKYFNKSRKFGRLFYTNFIVLSTLLMLGLIRILTGLFRDRPVVLISIAVIVLAVGIIWYLNRLTGLVSTVTIPALYKKQILPARQAESSWQWDYFLLGTLVAAFAPEVQRLERGTDSGWSSGDSSGSSGDASSCGSSCGSCGGCGGD
ncbi:MAG: hypothetical protein ACTHMM_19850 [Agriterribacter sp.]